MVNEYLLENLKEEGKRLDIPPNKTRALIREYLQSKIIYYLYSEKEAKNLSFIGGTSLRLLRNLDRFSEDLDFDNFGMPFSLVQAVFLKVKVKLEKEGFVLEYKMKKINNSGIGSMRFKNLLFQLKISNHKSENLVISINYTSPKSKPVTESVVLSRFGLVQNVTTNTLEFLFSQKIRAVLTREEIQPRDFYDIVWFLSHNIKPDEKLFEEMGIKNKKELFLKLEEVYEKKMRPNIQALKKRLAPFLSNEKKVNYLDIFGEIMKQNISFVH